MFINEIQQRKVFEAVKTLGKGAQPSFLRLEQLADNSKGRYTFPVKKSTGTVIPTEVRIDENDMFVATHVRLRIKQEDPAKPGSAMYQSYGNQTAIPVVALEVVAADVESHWNSKLNIVVDATEKLKAFDMGLSRVVPATQQSAATNRSEQHEFDGYVPLNGAYFLSGSKNNEINLDTPAYAGKLTQNVAGALRIYLALEFYGFLVPGGSGLGDVNNNF